MGLTSSRCAKHPRIDHLYDRGKAKPLAMDGDLLARSSDWTVRCDLSDGQSRCGNQIHRGIVRRHELLLQMDLLDRHRAAVAVERRRASWLGGYCAKLEEDSSSHFFALRTAMESAKH